MSLQTHSESFYWTNIKCNSESHSENHLESNLESYVSHVSHVNISSHLVCELNESENYHSTSF